MKKSTRILSLVLAVILCAGMLVLPASAATSEQITKAKALWSLGLFQGYDDSGNNFGLDDLATREHALVFLIRLLGEEAAALKWTGATPYKDVPADNWAKPYIGYAKEKGYTVGIGDDLFGFAKNATMREMTMFVLRGLGYSDATPINDFSWENCVTFAAQKGVIESDKIITPFTRGVAVEILFGAIATNVKGQDYDLLRKLMNMGVVTEEQYDNCEKIVSGETVPVTKSKATFKIVNNTGKSIKEFYVNTDPHPENKTEYISAKNYASLSNGKYFNLIFNFTKDSAFNFYIRFADGTEASASGLSFANATTEGGSVKVTADKVSLYVGTSKTASTSIPLTVTKAAPVTEKTVTIYNMTGKTWTGLYSTSVLVDNWGEDLSSGSVANNSSLQVIFPVSADEYKFDLKAVYSAGTYLFEGLDMSKVASGATLYLYLDGTTPTISTTKPAENGERIVTMTIINSTGKTFTAIYSTSNMDTSWGTTDLLAGDDFGQITLEFPITEDVTKYDLKFVETPQVSHIISNLDFSAASGKVTVELTWNGSNVICTQIG